MVHQGRGATPDLALYESFFDGPRLGIHDALSALGARLRARRQSQSVSVRHDGGRRGRPP